MLSSAFLQTDAAFAEACSMDADLASGTTALTALVIGRSVSSCYRFFLLRRVISKCLHFYLFLSMQLPGGGQCWRLQSSALPTG